MSANMFHHTAASHPGLVRPNNEDNLFCGGKILDEATRDVPFSSRGREASPCVFAVCDGMGGISAGELASLTAVKTLLEHESAITSAASYEAVCAAAASFVRDANEKLCSIMRKQMIRLGTTLAMVAINDRSVVAFNIGDSRIYRMSGGKLAQISEEHTIAAQKVRMGLLTKEQGLHDKSRHVLTRCLGTFEDEMIVEAFAAEPFFRVLGDRLLLCSDGLTDMVGDAELEKMLKCGATADDLVAAAMNNGGRDNVTCIVIDLGE